MPSSGAPEYIVGIDLGTTHSLLAYTEARPPEDEAAPIRLMAIPQVVNPGEIESRPLLPSFLFLPGPHDVAEGALALPWDPVIDFAVGHFARERGIELPARLISSAKSWLCHRGIDRTQPVLPWNAPPDARRLSPLEASARYLLHLRNAWDHQMAAENQDARLENQDILLTVPASFDAVARELTVKAAQMAGLGNLTLLEEPQAALYAWLHNEGERWRELVAMGESILVCDVGGGTTDFSLIRVGERDGNLDLHRAAVGNHILLGGDNMDLTLAYTVRAKLSREGTELDAWQFHSLWHACRNAKERLLNDPESESEPVVVLGRGTSLIGGTIRTEITREEVDSILLEGFFPEGEAGDYPEKKAQVGMREIGLPYASDPAITRHLAEFLGRQTGAVETGAPIDFPSAVLFNGGVMKAASLRARILSALRRWSGNPDLRELASADPDYAVAIGAAYYGLARKGRGIRIRAGTARSYYIGIESAMPSVPGIPTPMRALCVVPFGMEEGTETEVREKEFGLVVGEPAVFHFLASTTRRSDRVGEAVEDWKGDIQEIATLQAHLPASDEQEGGTILPVWLRSRVTELSTLELWCVARDSERQWKLELDLREQRQARD